MALDWGIGHYERTADDIAPVARLAVAAANVRSGEAALDLGCGSGNVALELAGAGAVVTAVDPAPRLVEVTRARAATAGVAVDALVGEAAAIPLEDQSVTLIVSVFAVIFAPDPAAALADMKRVLAPGGRMVLTAWVPGYGIGKAYEAIGPSVAAALGTSPPPDRFGWHDFDTLSALAGPLGLAVTMEERAIEFSADSPEAQVELDAEAHPFWVDTIAALKLAGATEDAIRQPALAALREVNEDPAAFRTTSRYTIATLT